MFVHQAQQHCMLVTGEKKNCQKRCSYCVAVTPHRTLLFCLDIFFVVIFDFWFKQLLQLGAVGVANKKIF